MAALMIIIVIKSRKGWRNRAANGLSNFCCCCCCYIETERWEGGGMVRRIVWNIPATHGMASYRSMAMILFFLLSAGFLVRATNKQTVGRYRSVRDAVTRTTIGGGDANTHTHTHTHKMITRDASRIGREARHVRKTTTVMWFTEWVPISTSTGTRVWVCVGVCQVGGPTLGPR